MKNQPGPQAWSDLRRGLRNRIHTITQRNRQIKDLKRQIEKEREKAKGWVEALKKISRGKVSVLPHPFNPDLFYRNFELGFNENCDIATEALSKYPEER